MEGENEQGESGSASRGSAIVFGGILGLLFVSTFLVAGPWAGFHAILLGGVGLLMLVFPPTIGLPRSWWVLAALFLVAGSSAFLPAGWFSMPEWRGELESLGVATGNMVVIQSRQAAEAFTLFAMTLFTGMWLAGHRPSSSQLRLWSLAFTLGVATYAVISRVIQQTDPAGNEGLFGFFPNRNHTATYLAMGTLCGFGCVLQALRDRRFPAMAVALVATGICLWAVAGWSVSRGGVVLVGVGSLFWLSMLGKRYLGEHGLRAVGLIALAAIGLFFIADSGVKERLSLTIEKTGTMVGSADRTFSGDGNSAIDPTHNLDFRIPTALDTVELIRDFKWTGIGAGQFYYVFPQYRDLTASANDSASYHPESDWLWMAAEVGIPATLALAALIFCACWKSLISILQGRDRALRSACLMAAMLVPIHGIFDVPGHRITLALSAAFMFSLSLRAPTDAGQGPAVFRRGFARLVAVLVIAASSLLIHAQWMAGPKPALVISRTQLELARQLYEKDSVLPRGARSESAGDLLEDALVVLEKAERIAPLDREVRRYQGFLALHFDDLGDLARKAFQIERGLDPTWVKAPMQQALAWFHADPNETVSLWKESLRRARRLDQHFPGNQWSEAMTRVRIREQTRGNPMMEKLRVEQIGD